MKKAPYQVALRQVQFYPMRPIVSHQDGHGLTGLGFLWIPQIKKNVSGLGIVPQVEIPTAGASMRPRHCSVSPLSCAAAADAKSKPAISPVAAGKGRPPAAQTCLGEIG